MSRHIKNIAQSLKKTSETITVGTIKEIAEDLPRHSVATYINKESLSEEYFEKAYQTLNDPYIYIILSNTGSAASEVLSIFTKKTYNHSSISFDHEFNTLISYNGGEKIFPPGLNQELLEWFYKKEEASVLIYKLEVTKEQKEKMIDKIVEINQDGSAYNLLGLAFKNSVKPNIMFCSQFVYSLLKEVGAHYFEKPATEIRPTDLVELDYYRKLQFVKQINFADIMIQESEQEQEQKEEEREL